MFPTFQASVQPINGKISTLINKEATRDSEHSGTNIKCGKKNINLAWIMIDI